MDTVETLAGLELLIDEGLEHQSQARLFSACVSVIELQAQGPLDLYRVEIEASEAMPR